MKVIATLAKHIRTFDRLALVTLSAIVVSTWYQAAPAQQLLGNFANKGMVLRSSPGEVFRVNTTSAGQQSSAKLAVYSSGSFMVVWLGEGFLGKSVYGRVFDETGSPVGQELALQETADEFSTDPNVAVDNSGQFLTLWVTYSDTDSRARQFSAEGVPLGPEFRVSIPNYVGGYEPISLEIDDQDRVTIAWPAFICGVEPCLSARRIDLSGAEIGDAIQITTMQMVSSWRSAVAPMSSGREVFCWTSDSGLYPRIYSAFLDSDGNHIQSDVLISSDTLDGLSPAVDADAQGNFVAVWTAKNGATTKNVYGQKFDSDGQAIGTTFHLAPTSGEYLRGQAYLDVADNGDFVVGWMEGPQSTGAGQYDIKVQRFFADTSQDGPAMAMRIETAVLVPIFCDMGMDLQGNVVVVFSSEDGDGAGVFGRVFAADGAVRSKSQTLGGLKSRFWRNR